MRDNGCFINCLEPKPQQLSYKIAYIKKVDGLTDGMENTHEMCQKIELHDTEPDNDLPEYIPYSEIHDKDTDEETKFVVIFATKPTLSFLNQGNTLHIDVTYRLVWNGSKRHKHRNGFPMNPMIVYGVTGKTRKHGCFSVLAHDEKAWTWNKVYTFNFCT